MTYEGKTRLVRGIKLGLTVLVAAVIGIVLGHVVSNYELRFMLDRTYYGTYRGIEIYTSGDIDTENFEKHAYMLSIVPDMLTENCEKIYFTGVNLNIPDNDTGFNSALGLTQDRTVYISTSSFGMDVLPHELFHVFDNTHGLPSSNDPEFRRVYDAEQGSINILAGSDTLRAAEYYAVSGTVYFVSPEELNAIAPRTYKYFNNVFGLFDL